LLPQPLSSLRLLKGVIYNWAPINKGIGRRRHSINETNHRLCTALVNVRVWDGYQILGPDTVFFENDTIVPFLTAADVVVDGQGGILLPGFIDSHVHPDTIAALEDLASFRASTVFTMACYDYNVCSSLRNQVGLSQYFSSGIAAHGTSGISPGPPDYVNVTTNASTNAAAEQLVSYVFGNGSDYMKIVSNQGGPDLATQSALVAFAHARGKTTMTHATLLEFYNPAILSKTNEL
jgi:hypothetical protein